ncbi:unnamed protein product [Pleuronectes platessa]|uniref:Uncharacterized protein n=1 Tax=Pleuronectes platessa TaxID=8262 RepID=A0A9N7VE09_PLEPL|nr:unnamed protein product [Pleuronectes platessa]
MLPKPRPKTKGPRWPMQWKADGQSSDGSRLQSAVQERKLLIHRHPSSGLGERGGRRGGGGKTEHCLTPSVWPLSNAFAWHIHGSHSYTHVKLIPLDDSAEAHQGAHLHSSPTGYFYPGCATSHRQFFCVTTVNPFRKTLLLSSLLTTSRSYQQPRHPALLRSSPLTISQSYQHPAFLPCPTLNKHP